ncbi:MAG TPA: helicase-related protein [Selenomonadales bacterium]|nr:helicase-related protein [Selenomonadales bacterium]
MNDSDLRRQAYEARKALISEIKKELLGPGSEYSIPDAAHEIITDLPEVRYSVGILFPQKERYGIDNNDSIRPSENAVEIDEYVLEEDEEPEVETIPSEHKIAVNDSEEESLEEEINLASQRLPSSMGFTFFVKGDCTRINFDLSFGTYRKTKLEDCVVPFTPEYENYEISIQLSHYVSFDKKQSLLRLISPLKKQDVFRAYDLDKIEDAVLKERLISLCNQFGRSGYIRVPHSIPITVDFSESDYVDDNGKIDGTTAKITALRRDVKDGVYSITVMMVNEAVGSYNGLNSIFQPMIRAVSDKTTPFSFCEYNSLSENFWGDEEELSLALLYRNKHVYGTGHGTSVDWSIDSNGHGYIENNFFPTNEVPQMDFDIPKASDVNTRCLSMKYLSDLDAGPKSEKINSLRTLVDSYSSWINDLVAMSKDTTKIAVKFQPKALEHIANCRESCERMYKGLELLASRENESAWNAFALANRAMFMQRIHLRVQETDKYPGDAALQKEMSSLNYYDAEDNYAWRPFQIAFLLMSIRSVVEQNCDERDIVDLIWFPTGGGKTEAYLGLTAFTIFFRRLAYPDIAGGTTVIMRYTLRLLAAQQFIRAATLICACEAIRGDCENHKKYPAYPLGKEAISIGLWIGGDHTPNKNDQAKKLWEKLTDPSVKDIRYVKDQYNKFQILKCPWCGTKLVKDSSPFDGKPVGTWGYAFKKNKNFYMSCTQQDCKFEGKLPIQIVDEELYENPPTLLFGTVDKFAMLPWKNDVGAFFATGTSNRTPDLIIQDELHLISGPLGTMVGLYETAVDALCSARGVKPKIIASTATIRRAKEQCSVLYNREVRQFPSPGLNAEDSFFAREAKLSSEDNRYGRIYVGIMPSGKTKAMMEVRTIAAIMQRVEMMQLPDEVKDKFWTLAVYFNSLRDLGKCSTLIDDDVKDFIKRTAYRFGLGRGRIIGGAAELTSRVSTSELNETLEKLERLQYSKENIKNKRYAVNTLLATNMISVGVDVARLNVMLLVGQPKLNSEYIQASSRIGRSYPGVAFTLYDGSKSRDRSHYEQFKAYHESFYKYVEPTGATPFSKPARDRALHAVVVTFLRHIYGLSLDGDAAMFDKESEQLGLDKIKEFIINRIHEINKRSTSSKIKGDTEVVSGEIEEFFKNWQQRVEIAGGKSFFYGDRYMVRHPVGDAKRLMKAYGSSGQDPAIETMISMRNVDKNIAANILIWEDDL